MLSVVPRTLQFVDEDDNGVIDANEQCKVRFQIVNQGRGDGYGCVAQTTFTGSTQGVTIQDVQLPVIPAGDKYWVEIPISATAQTTTGEIALSIVVNEPNGFGTEKIQSTIGTHKLKTPYVNVVSYKVLGSTTGTLQRRKPFTLQVIVQNTDQGTAENVEVGVTFPANVSRIGGDMNNLTVASLQAGESRTLEYELIANQEAAEMMDIQIALCRPTAFVGILLQTQFVDPHLHAAVGIGMVAYTYHDGLHLAKRRVADDGNAVTGFLGVVAGI